MSEGLTKKEKRELAKEEKYQDAMKAERMATFKKWGMLAIVGVVAFFVTVKLVKWGTTPVETPSSDVITQTENQWVKGDENAPITLTEFGDFQCPACRQYSGLVKQLSEEHSSEVKVVYRNFPLINLHQNAFAAAKAAEAAGKQGKFWEMHDMLYEKQAEWEKLSNAQEEFARYAGDIGLDVDMFKSDFESSDVEKSVQEDLTLALTLKLSGTPTFFVNGKKIQLPSSYDALVEAVLKDLP